MSHERGGHRRLPRRQLRPRRLPRRPSTCSATDARFLWHKDTSLAGIDRVILPGGFSYGDYLRCGALARFSPIMTAVAQFAEAGGPVLGICNGFQILCEAGLLPGALARNASLKFICEDVHVRVESDRPRQSPAASPRARCCACPSPTPRAPTRSTRPRLEGLEGRGQVVLRYCDRDGEVDRGAPTPTARATTSPACATRPATWSGLMPHPERAERGRCSAARTAACCSRRSSVHEAARGGSSALLASPAPRAPCPSTASLELRSARCASCASTSSRPPRSSRPSSAPSSGCRPRAAAHAAPGGHGAALHL